MAFAWRDLAVRLAFGIVAGCIAGLFDLWIFELSLRGFFAGLAGGVGYSLMLTVVYAPLFAPGMRLPRWLLATLAIVAGAAGATCWWLVCRCAALWAALLVGAALALSHFASGGAFFRR
jgi:hypothetical protein